MDLPLSHRVNSWSRSVNGPGMVNSQAKCQESDLSGTSPEPEPAQLEKDALRTLADAVVVQHLLPLSDSVVVA